MDQVTTADGDANAPATLLDPQQVWQIAQEELRFQLSRPGYETWLANAVLVEFDGRTFTVGVPTRLARDWLTGSRSGARSSCLRPTSLSRSPTTEPRWLRWRSVRTAPTSRA